jgi:5-methylcytosine-specific restriction endonuclease McrA
MRKSELYYDIKCAYCGEYFTPKVVNAKFCSKKCISKHNKEKYNRERKLTDFVIFERDGFKCIYCGKSSIEDGAKLILEHIYPVDKGGNADIFNIVTACTSCNGQKHSKIMSDDNIIRLWAEIDKRNSEGNEDHFNMLRDKMDKQLKNRKERLK